MQVDMKEQLLEDAISFSNTNDIDITTADAKIIRTQGKPSSLANTLYKHRL